MKAIVDTSVWSLALRSGRKSSQLHVALLRDLIVDARVGLLGAVGQEVLSGICHNNQFDRLRTYLRAFPNLELVIEDYELASAFYNTCRRKGVQGANTDFLICAASARRSYDILTTDKDFDIFSQHVPIVLADVSQMI
ncbi:MAG: type II toxin-antitoxin system VapC family toxin [Gammaproteobacteria bacterium]